MDHLHIIFDPMLSKQILLFLALAIFGLIAFALFRRARGAVFRTILFSLLLLVLANPSFVREKREPLKDTALVVIDDSASMKLGDRTQQVSKAAEAMAAKLAKFSDLDVETIHVAGDNETDLFHAIEQKRSQIPADRLAGVIALTDGEIHDTATAVLSAPFHVLIAGHKNEVDRRLVIKSAPAYGIVGQQVTLKIRVDDAPKPQSKTATVSMTGDDGVQQTVVVPVGEDVAVKTAITHAGANLRAFEVEALPDELTPINNVATAAINGIRDRLRVLLVSGEPHSGGRQWRNMLKADPDVDLVHFTILRSPFKDNEAPQRELSLIAFPSQEMFDTKLKKFDLVIFDGFTNRTLIPDRYLANIAKYVEEGGALLITNATSTEANEFSASPLARILPTTPTGNLLKGSFVPDVSAAGKRHPVTAKLTSVMPQSMWSPWYRQVEAQVKSDDDQVLLTGINQKPLLVLAHVGKGRVAQFLSNQFWLWAREYPQGGPQMELLRRTAHWLVSEPELDETALRAHVESKAEGWEIQITKQSLHDETAEVVVTGPDNQPVQVTLINGDGVNHSVPSGALHATVPVKTAGLYHIKDSTHEILVTTGAPDAPEFGAMVATDQVLRPVAEKSGGAVFWLADKADGPDIRRTDNNDAQSGWDWIGLKKNGQYRITGSEVYPLWPAWAALALLLALAMWAWRREGK